MPSHQPSTLFAEMWVEESDGEGKDPPSHSSEAGALPQSSSHPKPLAVSWLTHVDVCMHARARAHTHTHTHTRTRTSIHAHMHCRVVSIMYVSISQCCKWRTRTVGGGHLLFNRHQDQLYSSLLRLATGTTEDSNTSSTTVAHRLIF